MKPPIWLSVILLGICAACVASSAKPSVLPNALKWVAPNVDPVLVLTTQPATCVRQDADLSQIEAGELLFNSPLLLGGQAAKAGLHCGSCHQNGRGNPHFVFPSVSGSPGTADVTHGLFGPLRADEVFNPVPIPDLASPDGQTRVDRVHSGVLETFLLAQIIEEFEGPAPSVVVIDDLAAYIRALDEASCVTDLRESLTWQQDYDRVMTGLMTLSDREQSDHPAYRNAIRAALGRLYRRYAGHRNNQIRAQLEQISLMVRDRAVSDEIDTAMQALQLQLGDHAEHSLYNPSQLARALAK